MTISSKTAAWFDHAFQRHISLSGAPSSPASWLNAMAGTCRTELLRRWVDTQSKDRARLATMQSGDARRVHYLSMEFLMGRAMGNAIAALGLQHSAHEVLARHGSDVAALLEREVDAALGNGGLGRLAACFLDSLAELELPAFGYGLRYQYGMFAQRIVDGQQVETPDDWLRDGNPWEVARHEVRYLVGFGGYVEGEATRRRWIPNEMVQAQAYDFIVPAHHGEHVATLRQWHATPARPLDFAALSRGDVETAARDRTRADVLNWVLYPDDSTVAGRTLRLRQEALLVSASVQDMMARHLNEGGNVFNFAQRNVVHLNDTHPALAPLELMRLLLDEHRLPWDAAWAITHAACSYTNHTLMPEALETWPVSLFEQQLPRHLDIAYEINHRFLLDVRTRFPGDEALIQRVSIVDEQGEKRVRMGTLSIVASRRVNGVSALHSQLMVQTLFADFARIFPTRFFNVTNGVTPRRWLVQANPALATLLDRRLSPSWRRDLMALKGLGDQASDPTLAQDLQAVKFTNKQRLAAWLYERLGIEIDPQSLVDVHVKRIHEYKRQLLNLLHVAARWQAMVDDPERDWVPRTVILAGKAASAYRTAKQIIRLANDMSRVINNDARLKGRLKLVFIPDYSVSVAERVMPAADLSEQISTAGTEASGTGNMKFSLNGALTIGTWDGANIEMAESMGAENMFVFGLRTDAVRALEQAGHTPATFIAKSPTLTRVLEAIEEGAFSPAEPARHRGLVDDLRHRDRYLLTADFDDYVATQARVDACFKDPMAWHTLAARNIAGMGPFSADRAIQDYVREVWALPTSP